MAANEAHWTREEVEATVADYLHMLTLELAGQTYNKTEHRKNLIGKLRGRNEGAVERKHQNISAILVAHGWPYISGYKPLGNFQTLLAEVVADRIAHDDGFDRAAESATAQPAVAPLISATKGLMVDAPKLSQTARVPIADYVVNGRKGIKRDYLDREARNISLGKAGEEFVVEYERKRLHEAGMKRLADRVDHVSQTQGDGLGYDVLSFDASGRELFIEVKTTAFGKDTPFFISKSEVDFSRSFPQHFHLYRLFEFRKSPRMFDLRGPVDRNCHLDPLSFIGRFS
ncbi:MAG: DUF3883 domain-containing protein [Betaproteobacteria bacterium]|nr:DUF3883 domain-containing protein [Betaproteobacteria bacterium]